MKTVEADVMHKLRAFARRTRRVFRSLHFLALALLIPLFRNRVSRSLSLKDKSILVIGSAPSASLEDLGPFDFVIGANGSPRLIDSAFGLVTDLLVCDHTIFNSTYHSVTQAVRDSGALWISPKKLLVVVGPRQDSEAVPYAETGKFSKVVVLSKTERKVILAWASRSFVLDSWDDHSMVGTGVFAIALSFFAGAKSVQFTGFNLRTGLSDGVRGPRHFYEDFFAHDLYTTEEIAENYTRSKPRSHSSADSLLLASLHLQKKPIGTNEAEFDPLLVNWWRS
jgi:hypothetical protein